VVDFLIRTEFICNFCYDFTRTLIYEPILEINQLIVFNERLIINQIDLLKIGVMSSRADYYLYIFQVIGLIVPLNIKK